MPTANINILAVLVAAVLTFVLGAVWYSPVLFAKQWMAAQGYTAEKLDEMKRKGVTRAYAVSVLCYLVTAYVMALLASYTNSTSLAQGLWLGFLCWLGFAAATRRSHTRSWTSAWWASITWPRSPISRACTTYFAASARP